MAPFINIAIVDDHPLYRKGLKDFLLTNDIQVVTEACDGKDLVEQLEAQSQHPDICLMDVGMPRMNGFETTLFLHKKWPSIKVIALSLYEHKYNIIQMIKNGAVAYLFKNGSPSQILEAINSVDINGYYYSETIEGKTPEVHLEDIHLHKDVNEKERHFLQLACSDMTYTEIAKIMSVSPRTVDGYRDSLFAKLHLKSRAGLVLFAVQTGIVDIKSLRD